MGGAPSGLGGSSTEIARGASGSTTAGEGATGDRGAVGADADAGRSGAGPPADAAGDSDAGRRIAASAPITTIAAPITPATSRGTARRPGRGKTDVPGERWTSDAAPASVVRRIG